MENVNQTLADAVVGENALNQIYIDRLLAEADGTANKENLGANALLGYPWQWPGRPPRRCVCPSGSIWRLSRQAPAGTYDEYPQRRKARG